MLRQLTLLLGVALLTACAALEGTPSGTERGAADAPDPVEPAIQVEPLETLESDEPEVLPSVDQEMSEPEAGGDEPGTDGVAGSGPPVTSPDEQGDTPDAPAGVVAAAEHAITGRIDLVAAGETIGPQQFRDIVVYFKPEADVRPPAPQRFEMRTERKRFAPEVLVIPAGSTVVFPNGDDILHNVFSVSPNAGFDLGRYGLGESRSYTFNDTGLALIHCDVHHAMQAEVLVVDTPYYTRVRDDGGFVLKGIPPGPGELRIWHPRADEQVKKMDLPVDGGVTARLELVKPRVARHENKSGESYRASGPEEPSPADEDDGESETAVAPGSDPDIAPAPAAGDGSGGDNIIEGRIALDADDEDPDPEQYRDIVVYYQPAAGAPRSEAGVYEIGTRNKTFSPDMTVVPVGSTVAFPNRDDILHNVFSVSPNAVFDLGRYGRGESRGHTFEEPGLALIHCDVHHHMQADVLVVDTPYFTRAGGDGAFRLVGLPDGPGTLHVWHPRADGAATQIELPRDDRIATRLVITKPRVPEHLNKFGEPYRKRRPDDNNS